MVRAKKQSSPEEERLVSKYLKEEECSFRMDKDSLHWRNVSIPSCITILPILTTLRTVEQSLEEAGEGEAEPFKLSMSESDTIETVRKDNVFSEEVTESEMGIIQQRVALQQRQFAEFERREKARKYKKVLAIYDYLTAEEMDEMLVDCGHDEDEMIVRLTQGGYLMGIRRVIATKHASEVASSQSLMSAEQQEAYQQLLKKRSETLKKTTNDTAKKQYRMGGRLALDDALKQVLEHNVDPDKAFEGWSQARIRAYQMIDQNPNSYYYRFNAPGEEQRKGQWSDDEKKSFFARLEEVGANGQWGLFAMKIPGRVGYQCSNFYRLLVETKQVHDPNYVLDAKGKAHYLFDKKMADGQVEKTFRTHSKHGTGRASEGASPGSSGGGGGSVRRRASPTTVDKRVKKRRRRTRGWDSDDDDDDDDDGLADYNDDSGTFRMSTRTLRRSRTRAYNEEGNEEEEEIDELEDDGPDNPLPGFVDPITLDEVVKPAISKYGHVMGYDSWVRCLTNWEGKKNICPLTKKTLTKRDLVILTYENIEEYRDQIVNV